MGETIRFEHTSVMRDEVVAALAPVDGGVYVDVTLGAGGRAEGILSAAPGWHRDRLRPRREAIHAARARLAPFGVDSPPSTRASGVPPELAGRSHALPVDGLCADLGVSSPQLDDPLRGMSFRREGPIDMRMDTDSGETALELIARLDDDELANVIYRYGEEHRSRRIARSIKRAEQEPSS